MPQILYEGLTTTIYRMKARSLKTTYPTSLMMWTLNDAVIEQPHILEEQFHDIKSKGFEGVAAFVRCSRYVWNDAEAIDTLRRISSLSKKSGMAFWLGADPRNISEKMVQDSGGLRILVYGDSTRSQQVPNTATIVDGKFSLRCAIQSRRVHTMHEVAIEYFPKGIERIYAIRKDVLDGASTAVLKKNVIDITERAHYFHHAIEQYVEAFGAFDSPDDGEWIVVGFFLFETNYFDYSDRRMMSRYLRELGRLKKERVLYDGLMWDEAGYACGFGMLPYSNAIALAVSKRWGHAFGRELWKWIAPSQDENLARFRSEYFRVVQESVNHAQEQTMQFVARVNKKSVFSGIHDTWHWESADMCDMNHGSLDLWKAAKVKSAGFIDLGSVNLLRNPSSDFYANLAAMCVIGKTLGTDRASFNNLWTMDEDAGDGWQAGVLRHCVDVMAMFGMRWLAHIYGPAGTIGEERSFLGLPPTPGYPDHSTWKYFPEWNARIKKHLALTEGCAPMANVAVIFPVEYMYSLADARANEVASNIFHLLLALTDAHYQVNVYADSIYKLKPDGEKIFGKNAPDETFVLAPYHRSDLFDASPEPSVTIMHTLCISQHHTSTKGNHDAKMCVKNSITEIVHWLAEKPEAKVLGAPERSWASVTTVKQGHILTLVPSRYTYEFSGVVRFQGATMKLEKVNSMVRILFQKNHAPVMLD